MLNLYTKDNTGRGPHGCTPPDIEKVGSFGITVAFGFVEQAKAATLIGDGHSWLPQDISQVSACLRSRAVVELTFAVVELTPAVVTGAVAVVPQKFDVAADSNRQRQVPSARL